jgi:hypothetical protein
MKKITLALVMLLALGLVAATAQMDATVSGSATATIGFDIDAGAFGIVNSATSDVSLTIASGDAATETMGGWYGEVSLTGMKLALDYAGGADFLSAVTGTDTTSDTDELPDDDIAGTVADSGLIVTAPTVAAKITNGSTDIQIWALDGFAVDVATEVENNGSDISVEDDDDDIATDLSDGTGGMTIGFAAGPADIKIYFATETGYDGADPDDNAHFLVGSDITLTAGPADIGLQVVRGIGVDETLGIGVTTGFAAGPLTVAVAADLQLVAETDPDYEVRLDAGIAVGGLGADLALWYAEDNVDVEISSGPAFGPLALTVLLGLYDVTTTLEWGVDVGATYTLNDMIKVALDVAFDSDTVVPVALTATISDPVPNVDVTVKWATADIAADTDNLGIFTIATKISY